MNTSILGELMEKYLFITILVFSITNIFAQKEVIYSEDEPLYSVVIPKGWNSTEYKDYKVFEIYNGDEKIVYSIYELSTSLLFEAVQRTDQEAETEFVSHEYTTAEDEVINGITFHKMTGWGITKEGKTFNIVVKLFRLTYNNYFMIYYSAAPRYLEYYQIELDAINNSIQKK